MGKIITLFQPGGLSSSFCLSEELSCGKGFWLIMGSYRKQKSDQWVGTKTLRGNSISNFKQIYKIKKVLYVIIFFPILFSFQFSLISSLA